MMHRWIDGLLDLFIDTLFRLALMFVEIPSAKKRLRPLQGIPFYELYFVLLAPAL